MSVTPQPPPWTRPIQPGEVLNLAKVALAATAQNASDNNAPSAVWTGLARWWQRARAWWTAPFWPAPSGLETPPGRKPPGPALQTAYLKRIEEMEGALLPLPQVDMPLTHRFAPGVYFREIFMPADTLVIGHLHKTHHFNVILTGRALVAMDGVVQEIVAPAVIQSDAYVRKVLYIQEDMRWATVHPTHETDLDRLEAELIIKSPTYLQYQQHLEDVARIRAALAAAKGT